MAQIVGICTKEPWPGLKRLERQWGACCSKQSSKVVVEAEDQQE